VDAKNPSAPPLVTTLSKEDLEKEMGGTGKGSSSSDSKDGDGAKSKDNKKKPKELTDTQKPGNSFGLPGINVDDSNQMLDIRIRIKL